MQTVRCAGGLHLLFHPDSWNSDLLTLPDISPILFNTLPIAKLFWLWRKEVRRGTKNFISCEHFSMLQGSKCCTDGMFKYWDILRITVKSLWEPFRLLCCTDCTYIFCMVTYFSTCAFYFSVDTFYFHILSPILGTFDTHFFHLIFISGFHVMYMCIYKIDQICIHVPLRCKKYSFCTGFFRSTRSWSKLCSKGNLK